MREQEFKKIINNNTINLYRGCTHGCIYCDSRSSCYQIDDFENIIIKKDALTKLSDELKGKRTKTILRTGAMCDPYIDIEKDLNLTKGLLELVLKYDFGIRLLTKSTLVLRDLELFKKINEKTYSMLEMTLTTFDDNLCKIIEPNVAVTSERLKTLKTFADNNIDTCVWLCPILPYINDTSDNIISLVKACADARVKRIICFGFGLTLRDGNREYFYKSLDKHFPGLKEKYHNEFGFSYNCSSSKHNELWKIFANECKKYNINFKLNDNMSYGKNIKFKIKQQISFFDDDN